MVMRVFPIRVAGTSGALLNETTWEALQEKYGSHIPIERTTVTDKVRRVGGFDYSLYHTAHRLCNPTAIFLTFADYLVPEWHDEEGNIGKWDIPKFSQELYNIVALVPETAYLGTGIGRFKTLYDKSRNDVSVEESCD
jgi:adenylosuccinate synthase